MSYRAILPHKHADFSLALDLGKSLVFPRVSESRSLAEWTEIPYISRMTDLYAQAKNPFSLRMKTTETTSWTYRS